MPGAAAWQYMGDFFNLDELDKLHCPELAKAAKEKSSEEKCSGKDDPSTEEDDFQEFFLPMRDFRGIIAEIKARGKDSLDNFLFLFLNAHKMRSRMYRQLK